MQEANANSKAFFCVSPQGQDTDPGTLERPFATLERARQAVRELKQSSGLPPGGVTVWLREGTYHLSGSFTLTQEDSGAPEAPLTWSAYQGEPVRLSGGRPVTDWGPVTDPAVLERLPQEACGQVWVADLPAQGITDFGELQRRGFGARNHLAALELFC